MEMARINAIQINVVDPVLTIRKNGKANAAENRAAPPYTGRRPMRSESAENIGTVNSEMAYASMIPDNTMLFGSPRVLVM